MSQDIEPKNELERKLLDAQEGRITPQELINALIAGEVFMPVYEKYQVGGFSASTQAKPLTLQDEESGKEVLVLFTSPDRAKAFVRDYPGYGGGLVIEFTWILERLGVGYGISLNPGQALGMELEARALQQLVAGRQ